MKRFCFVKFLLFSNIYQVVSYFTKCPSISISSFCHILSNGSLWLWSHKTPHRRRSTTVSSMLWNKYCHQYFIPTALLRIIILFQNRPNLLPVFWEMWNKRDVKFYFTILEKFQSSRASCFLSLLIIVYIFTSLITLLALLNNDETCKISYRDIFSQRDVLKLCLSILPQIKNIVIVKFYVM